MRINSAYTNEAYAFFQRSGYPDAQLVESFKGEIIISEPDTYVQIFVGGWDKEENIVLFIGSVYPDGFRWRLLEADFALLLTPAYYILVPARSLLEFILNNNFHRTHRIASKRKATSIIIKIPVFWITYGMASDVRRFHRPFGSEKLQDCYFEYPALCDECGMEV